MGLCSLAKRIFNGYGREVTGYVANLELQLAALQKTRAQYPLQLEDTQKIKLCGVHGYSFRENLLMTIQPKLSGVAGDILDVGVCKCDLTVALAQIAASLNKKVFAVDICDIDFDAEYTDNKKVFLPTFYRDIGLTSETQEAYIRGVLSGYSNVEFIKADSKIVKFPKAQKFCFAVVDGCHLPEYVHSDFNLAWRHLSKGGYLAMHDYMGDLQTCTDAIDECIDELVERGEVAYENVFRVEGWWVVIPKNA